MTDIKLNKQIAFLRKEKGITQEELAQALGVTNQSVSKWESSQCCPDIQLLPAMAEYFGVSVDELLGYRGADTSKDMILQLRDIMDSLPAGEDNKFALKVAYALHAIICAKIIRENAINTPGLDLERFIREAGDHTTYMQIALPEITTFMRMESVFYTSNKNLNLNSARLRKIAAVAKIFSDTKNLKTAVAIFELTARSGNERYVSVSEIAEEAGLTESDVRECMENGLAEYLTERRNDSALVYRIDDSYMHIVPMLAMFCDVG